MEGFFISICIGVIAILAYRYKDKLGKSKNRRKYYSSVEEAAEDYEKTIFDRLLNDNFYLMRVSCANCKLTGSIYIENEVEAEGSTCPGCMVDGLKVLGKGGKKIVYTPPMSDETAEKVQALVEQFIEQGLETGEIERDGIFRGW